MLKKTLTLTVLGAMSLAGLFAAGCTSNDAKPYALTGMNDTTVSPTPQERARYTDSKGRYREDLRMIGVAQRP